MSTPKIIPPKNIKNPPYQKISKRRPPNTRPMTFAAFWSIFIGPAEALESISESHSVFAYILLYESRN